MDSDPIDRLPRVSRPVGVLAGVLLLVPAFFLAWAGVGVPLIFGRKADVATLLISVASLWGAVLCLSTSWRLLANRSRSDGGLVSPLFLRAAALLFAALPVMAVATGSWRSGKAHPAFLAIQMLSYFAAAITLFRLARKRQARKQPFPESGSSREKHG